MRICTFPLNYVDSSGNDKIVYVDESDYTKYISGEKTLDESFGHYIDPIIMEDLRNFEKTNY